MRWRERMNRFMQGRYGVDSLSRCMVGIAVACMVITMFTKGTVHSILYVLSLFILGAGYFRMFSRDYARRYEENRLFLEKTAGIRKYLNQQKYLLSQKKTHHIYKCPDCRQKIRIPRGRGRIEITCPKCGAKFIKRS